MATINSAALAPPCSRSPAAAPSSAFLSGSLGLSTLRRGGIIAAAPIRRHHRAAVVAAAREDAAADTAATKIKLDRREMLLAGSAAAMGGVGKARATPVGDPDLKRCGPGEVVKKDWSTGKETVLQLACCAPKAKGDPIDFKADTGPLRTRPPAHMLDQDYIDKLTRAYAEMRALPDSDPRSMKQQANVHCAYCNYAYRQEGNSKAQLQIHNTWLFLPWHRFYLYFHEKILGDLIGDPTFALPFWNWDNQAGGSAIPQCFWDETSALYDVNRRVEAYQTIVNLGSFTVDPAANQELIKRDNINLMHTSVANAPGAQEFMGGPLRYAQPPAESSAGTLEASPHTTVHVYAGNPLNPNGEDMGNFYSAGRDPLFYCHHGNVDRLWNVWQDLGRTDWNDPDFLDAEFLFFNEKSQMVRCKVKDSLNTRSDMGYIYQDMSASDDIWINYAPVSGRSAVLAAKGGTASVVGLSDVAMAAEYPTLSNVNLQGKPVVSSVSQPKQSGTKDEILVLEGVEVPMNSNAGFDVFINFPEADKTTPLSIAEYVGSINNVPHVMPGMSNNEPRVTNGRFSIRENVKTLGVADASKLTVTLVPKVNEQMKVKSARIEYYS